MPEKDYQGVVTSVSVPFQDGNGASCFVFSMPKLGYPSSDPATFYLALDAPFADRIIELVLTAYRLGVDVQTN